MNLAAANTSLFEPQQYAIPFAEFRVVISVHTSHSNEDPYVYEFLVDFSQIKVSAEQKIKPVEVYYLHGENNIVVGTQVIFDANSELGNHLNYQGNLDTSFQSTGSQSSMKPDFGKNVFIVLKYFTISIPLKRVEKRIKEGVQIPQEDPTGGLLQQKAAVGVSQQQQQQQQKKVSKLQLNPNAPLFSNAGDFEPNPQGYYPPGYQQQHQAQVQAQAQQQNKGPMFPANLQGQQQQQQQHLQHQQQQQQQQFKPQGNFGGFQGNMGQGGQGGQQQHNMYHNAPPQYQQHQQQQHQQHQYQQHQHQQQNYPPQNQQQQQQEFNFPPGFNLAGQPGMIKPPGLIMNASGQPSMMPQPFPSQSGFPNANSDSPQKRASLQVDTKLGSKYPANTIHPIEDMPSGKFNFEAPMTPERQEEPKSATMEDRGRVKNLSATLYAAVLSGQRKDSDHSKSPSLSKIQHKYFSGFSTPRSDNTFTPPQANTPLRRLTPTGSHAEIGGDDGDQQWTEDMIENFKLENYIDNLVEFAKTYNGSRVLQKFFPRASQPEIDLVINKIQDSIEELMLDPYANYMFQTLAQSCSSEQRYQLLQKVRTGII